MDRISNDDKSSGQSKGNISDESFPGVLPNTSSTSTTEIDLVANSLVSTPRTSENFNEILNNWRDRQEAIVTDMPPTKSDDSKTNTQSKTRKRNQRRKANARKAKSAAEAVGLTKEHTSTSESNQPGKTDGGPKSSHPSEAAGQKSKKRRNTDFASPAESSVSKRIDKKATPLNLQSKSFADALREAELVLAIVHLMGKQIKPIDKEQYQLVFGAINSVMFDDLDSNFMPNFNGTTIKRDIVRVECACLETKKWLLTKAARLSEITGLQLHICEFNKVPWPRKFMAFFPHTKEENGRLLKMLNRCNPALPDIEWEIVKRKEGDSGVHLLVKVDDDTAEILRKNHDGLRFGAGKALIREFAPKKRKSKTIGQAETETEAALGDTDVAEEELTALADMSLEEVSTDTQTKHSKASAVAGGPSTVDLTTHDDITLDNSIEMVAIDFKGGPPAPKDVLKHSLEILGGTATTAEPPEKVDQ